MLITNLFLFQLAWFSCAAGAAYQMPWLGVFVTLIILSWHLYKAKQAKPELLLMVLTLIIGACFDQVMLMAQWVEYQSHGWSDALVPAWILAMWVAFASTLNLSLAWMQGKYLIAMLFGTAGGPIAYFAAERLGAVNLNGIMAYIALSVGWAMITPLLIYLTKYMNGFKIRET